MGIRELRKGLRENFRDQIGQDTDTSINPEDELDYEDLDDKGKEIRDLQSELNYKDTVIREKEKEIWDYKNQEKIILIIGAILFILFVCNS